MALVEADATAKEVASEIRYDIPDSYMVKAGYEAGTTKPLGVSVTRDGETYRVAAALRTQINDDRDVIRDIVPLCRIDEDDEIGRIRQDEWQVLRQFFGPGVMFHPSPFNHRILEGEYDGLLEPEEETVSPYRNGTTPISRLI